MNIDPTRNESTSKYAHYYDSNVYKNAKGKFSDEFLDLVKDRHGTSEVDRLLSLTDSDYHSSALYLVIKYLKNDIELVKFLVERNNEDVNGLGPLDQTPIFEASLDANEDIIEYLVSKGANINHIDAKDRTSLTYAIDDHTLNRVEILVKHGAKLLVKNDDFVKNDRAFISLLYFINFSSIEISGTTIAIAKFLLNAQQIEINMVDPHFGTILHQAAKVMNSEFVEYLLKQGADPFIEDVTGKSAHDILTRNYNYKLRLETMLGSRVDANLKQIILKSLELLQNPFNMLESDESEFHKLTANAVKSLAQELKQYIQNATEVNEKINVNKTEQDQPMLLTTKLIYKHIKESFKNSKEVGFTQEELDYVAFIMSNITHSLLANHNIDNLVEKANSVADLIIGEFKSTAMIEDILHAVNIDPNSSVEKLLFSSLYMKLAEKVISEIEEGTIEYKEVKDIDYLCKELFSYVISLRDPNYYHDLYKKMIDFNGSHGAIDQAKIEYSDLKKKDEEIKATNDKIKLEKMIESLVKEMVNSALSAVDKIGVITEESSSIALNEQPIEDLSINVSGVVLND